VEVDRSTREDHSDEGRGTIVRSSTAGRGGEAVAGDRDSTTEGEDRHEEKRGADRREADRSWVGWVLCRTWLAWMVWAVLTRMFSIG
jgi:hypothetical protein